MTLKYDSDGYDQYGYDPQGRLNPLGGLNQYMTRLPKVLEHGDEITSPLVRKVINSLPDWMRPVSVQEDVNENGIVYDLICFSVRFCNDPSEELYHKIGHGHIHVPQKPPGNEAEVIRQAIAEAGMMVSNSKRIELEGGDGALGGMFWRDTRWRNG